MKALPRPIFSLAAFTLCLLGNSTPAQESPFCALELRLDAVPATAEASELDAWIATSSVGLDTLEQLVDLIRASDVDAVVFWVEESQEPHRLSVEPHAETADILTEAQGPAETILMLRKLEARLALDHVQVAIGASSPDEDHRGLDQHLRLRGLGSNVLLRRVRRPGVSRLLWFDLSWAAERIREAGPQISYDSLAIPSVAAELRRTQLDLDLACFWSALHWDGRREEKTERQLLRSRLTSQQSSPWSDSDLLPAQRAACIDALLEQSDLISAVARRIGGAEPQRLFPAQNRWVGERPSQRAIPALRHAPESLDLFEWLFSEPTAAAEPALASPGLPRPLPNLSSADFGAERPGLLGAAQRRALRAFFVAREQGARYLLDFLIDGSEEARSGALQSLSRAADAAASLPVGLRPQVGELEVQQAKLRELEALRLLSRDWTVHEISGSRSRKVGQVRTAILDDQRYEEWASWLLRQRGLDRVDLSRLRSGGVTSTWMLETEIPLQESRNARLDLAIDATVEVEVNGISLVSNYNAREAFWGPLRLCIPLAAGRNIVRVQWNTETAISTATLSLAPLPRRLEGIHLSAPQARDIDGDVVALQHPLALHDEVLVIPERPGRSGPAEGSVDFSLSPLRDRRVDVWLRGQALQASQGQLQLQLDQGSRINLTFPPGGGWTWARVPRPLRLNPGVHQLRLHFRERGVMVDTLSLLETGSLFPAPPNGEVALHDSAWRYDPLGVGQRLALGGLRKNANARTFVPNKTQGYRVFVWMRGDRPLRRSQRCELELSSTAQTWRFNLPAGTPVEEWVALGRLSFRAEDPVEVRARGDGHPAFLCFVP